jgi:hypothetical protein
MKREKAREFIASLVSLRRLATDEQASQAPSVYPEWREGVSFEVNDRVLYGGVLYKVLIAHTSQTDWTPDKAVSLFAKVLIPDEEEIYPWEQPDSTNGYSKGDKVTHIGFTWVSTLDNNVWEPGIYGWDEV